MKNIILIIFLFLTLDTIAQNIITFAGCGIMCTGLGDGGPATAAALTDPGQGTFDKYGYYYFAEPTGERIRRISTSGIISTIAGNGSSGFAGDGGLATAAILSSPSCVILDTLGNLYIADANNERIRKVDAATGIITTIVGDGVGAFLGDGQPATAAEVWGPQTICFDKYCNLYIADEFNTRIRKVNTNGIISTFAGSGGFSSLGTGDGGQATAATFNSIVGVAADGEGNIYISDFNAGKIRKVDTFGIISTFAGNGTLTYIGDGTAATAAQIAPEWLIFDDVGNLIVGDRLNERVYKIDTAGIFHCIAGIGGSGSYSGDGGPASAASLDPGGACFDPCGNLYIRDIDNARVREIVYNPTCNISLKVNNIKSNRQFSIYPNPAYDQLTITNTSTVHEVTVSNLIGQQVFDQVYDAEKAEVNISGLPPGVYVVRATDGDGNVILRKVLKE